MFLGTTFRAKNVYFALLLACLIAGNSFRFVVFEVRVEILFDLKMPKRKISEEKKCEVRKLNKKLKKIQDKLRLLDSSDSSFTSSSESSGSSSDVEPNNEEIQIIPQTETAPEQIEVDFDFFGSKPLDEAQIGVAIHNEIAVRWSAVLQSGLTSAQRSDITEKYKIPENCLQLLPPKTNDEIQPCLPDGVLKHDKFVTALQLQLAHGLSAIATIINKNLPVAEQANDTKVLGEACQIFANVHNALSIHRKYKILPHLHPDCAKVAKNIKMDNNLFGKDFHEVFKNDQALKKSSAVLKKRASTAMTATAGTSGLQQKYRQSLNYQRPQYKGKFKEGVRREERLPRERSKWNQRKEQQYHQRRK
ncbi:uncharacterized protein LOC126750729 [Anthonomus grandis grandis]|uniref:uncharacterized protein LOC126750729 n=1 Tax=Anthonomus grandis grandis TaxID=2921223 RepID=UPI0021650E5B|nr:uncharacterized protein LOC126750729 [Anthonomus grandis grandis]XP_050316399.1 uncharacterized protein LOC126750729 [Anthonomus grandis grandis]